MVERLLKSIFIAWRVKGQREHTCTFVGKSPTYLCTRIRRNEWTYPHGCRVGVGAHGREFWSIFVLRTYQLNQPTFLRDDDDTQTKNTENNSPLKTLPIHNFLADFLSPNPLFLSSHLPDDWFSFTHKKEKMLLHSQPFWDSLQSGIYW